MSDTQVIPSYSGARTVPRQPREGAGTATDAGIGPVGAPQGWTPSGELPEVSATAAEGKQPWYPGRRVDLGLVLLPLRAVLGSLSVYAGFSKLCDPVYFDGGERGSMMRWLASLHPGRSPNRCWPSPWRTRSAPAWWCRSPRSWSAC